MLYFKRHGEISNMHEKAFQLGRLANKIGKLLVNTSCSGFCAISGHKGNFHILISTPHPNFYSPPLILREQLTLQQTRRIPSFWNQHQTSRGLPRRYGAQRSGDGSLVPCTISFQQNSEHWKLEHLVLHT